MFVFTAGVLVRREVRRFLLREGASFSEDRGWLDSQFVVRGPEHKIPYIRKCITEEAGKG